ncbi:pistil-specific extensin-like protein [Vitis vinifera]|uniref:pistil-specific extensin-like protein n=1 Tax=Vitis vinifera TaxID=29760 RepID=UPI00053F7DFE|nr:pistil-specific extensin-like protein [Vitis vinifera]|eukprot:XP_010655168.1 PREDICTED: pistil-specific extensin-like protein [Vitis vinifera]
MARTRGAKSSSPSSRKRIPREEPVPDPTSEPPWPKVVSPPTKPAPQKPPARRYLTRSGGRPLQKRARVESLEPIDLTEQSPEPSPAPSLVSSPAPPAQPQELQPPLSEPQIPSGVAPEMIIMRLMLTQPPIEGNLDCRADAIPLLFPRLLCQILEHLGYPSDPKLERKHICREVFTLDKWNNMTTYRVKQPGQPQPAAIPTTRRASPRHIPEGIPIASPIISRAPPVTPASSQPSSSTEPRMAIPISEYKELCRSL